MMAKYFLFVNISKTACPNKSMNFKLLIIQLISYTGFKSNLSNNLRFSFFSKTYLST